jgi:hypothetical protein
VHRAFWEPTVHEGRSLLREAKSLLNIGQLREFTTIFRAKISNGTVIAQGIGDEQWG